MEIMEFFKELMLDYFLLSWMQLIQLLHKVLFLYLIKLFFWDLNLLQRSQSFAQFVRLRKYVVIRLLQLLIYMKSTVFSSYSSFLATPNFRLITLKAILASKVTRSAVSVSNKSEKFLTREALSSLRWAQWYLSTNSWKLSCWLYLASS